MSNGYLLADTNSLVFAYRAGGTELLDIYLDATKEGGRKFAITERVFKEIDDGPLKLELLPYITHRNITILPNPSTDQDIESGKITTTSAGEYSMLEIAKEEGERGRATRIWADDGFFDSQQLIFQNPDAHRSMSWELLGEAYDQKFIDAAEYEKYRAGYQVQRAFIDSQRLNSFQYDFPSPEIDAPQRARVRGIAGGVVLEAAITTHEWDETRQRAQVFRDTLRNDTAATDAYMQQGAQTAGALVGTAAGGVTAAALGTGTAGTALLVAGEGYLFGKAAERGVELWQQHSIYNVTSEGVDWSFNGRQWIRQDLLADLVDDARDLPQQQNFAAPPDKARELSAAASAKAVEQALGAVPEPRNPFVLPANDSDAHSLRARDWNYQPDTGQWLREVVTDLDHREMPSKFKTIEADDARAAQLSAQALQIIDGNLRAGPAQIAAQYQRGHKAYGYEQTPAGAMPEAIGPALNPDLLQASDGRHYRRDAQGEWTHEGKTADPTRALELELTRERLLPALEDHQQQLDRMPPWQPPTPEALDKAMLREAYLHRGIDRETRQESFDASYLAVQRTRADTGVTAASTSLVLGQDASGRFTPDSPIHHLRIDADGAVRIAAITSPEDIERALADVRARGRSENAPSPSLPSDFAPGRQQAPDVRNPEHPGHDAFRELRHKVSLYEARQGIPHGEHTDRVAAALLRVAVENGIPPHKAQLAKDPVTGQTHLLDRRDPFQSEQQCPRIAVDVMRMSSQPVDASSQRLDQTVLRHDATAQAQQRTPQQSQALAALGFDDQMLFARIRRDLPGHVSDDHAALAMQRARQEGLRDAGSLGTVMMIGSDIYVRGHGEAAKDLKVDSATPAPPLQASVDAVNMANQQKTPPSAQQHHPAQDDQTPRLARFG
jgi:hypothetical protein